MAKCGKKVKNACKMCLQPVTQKTGLQCQGACLSWVHYNCLNYTPGRIKDIKTGIIKVTCPCPDCKTKFPKEYRTDEVFSCTNDQCPANHPPKCVNISCPSNTVPPELPPIIPGHPMPALSECGQMCRKWNGPPPQPLQPPTADARTNVQFTNQGSSTRYPSPCPSSGDVPGKTNSEGGFPCLEAVEQMCCTVGQLTTQINDLMTKMKQVMQAQGGGKAGGGFSPAGRTGACTHKGPKSKCPTPCHCPGNPAKRK